MMWWNWDGFNWEFMGIGLLWMVIFWGLIIALIVWGVKRLGGHHQNITTGNPVDKAKERYSRGEIDKEQFEQIKKDIQN